MSNPLNNINPHVKKALKRIDRCDFVPDVLKHNASEDRPVPIGLGQTCSQPRLVAYMTDLLKVEEGSRVLEIGTGSGYQTALLLELGCVVFSIEIFDELALSAENRLNRLGYDNFKIRIFDGSLGWIEEAPFDRCIITCAAKEFPEEITKQLKTGARAVFPHEVGKETQNLMVGIKNDNGKLECEFATSVLFVPLLKTRGD